MDDYISREAVLALKQPIGAYGMDIESKAVEQVPAADVRPVVKAHWIYHEDDYDDYYECSNCHDEYVVYESDMTWKYCPTCGAKMEA